MTPFLLLAVVGTFPQQVRTFYLPGENVFEVRVHEGTVFARTARRAFRFNGETFVEGTWPGAAVERVVVPEEGRPFGPVTASARGPAGDIWAGTRKGAMHWDGKVWEYRQGRRWLPHDEVRSVAVDASGAAWFGTANGVGRIAAVPMTLREKARFFEDEIDKRHRRTPFGYVDAVELARAGDLSEWSQRDSDNDGLWTAMYGAGECFAYAATKDPRAKERARAAFEALRFLGTVTQGGRNAPPPGFVARSILPVSGPDPNVRDSLERDRERQRTRDRMWKVFAPRWPVSADGKWYWKTDTSSDELDGHYFFYSLYYDLVAATEAERAPVREHVRALTDHLVNHGFALVDHDGKPTRWAVFGPQELNQNAAWWEERGLNSLSILAYLRTAEHITGERRYGAAVEELVRKHGYAANVMIPKTNAGPGSGNQSDDEMAFMGLYCLLKYERDARLRQMYGLAFRNRWEMERPELNPLFNFMFAGAVGELTFDADQRPMRLAPEGDWLGESIDTLKRYPLDRVDWGMENSHRLDVVPLPEWAGGSRTRGARRNGRVLPIDERFVNQWNHDPWQLDYGGQGRRLADGASFLLPYYMGLYHGFVE